MAVAMTVGTVGVVAIAGPGRAIMPVRVDLAPIERPALFGIGQQIIGGGRLLEQLFRLRVAGIEIGMMFSRALKIGPADLLRAGISPKPKRFVGIVQCVAP